MHDVMQPLIHKAPVHEIAVNVSRMGLSIGDTAELHELTDGKIGVFALVLRPFLGLFPRRRIIGLGVLGPASERLIRQAVVRRETLRVRIVDLMPEHLTSEGQGPEIHISIWGDPRHLDLPMHDQFDKDPVGSGR